MKLFTHSAPKFLLCSALLVIGTVNCKKSSKSASNEQAPAQAPALSPTELQQPNNPETKAPEVKNSDTTVPETTDTSEADKETSANTTPELPQWVSLDEAKKCEVAQSYIAQFISEKAQSRVKIAESNCKFVEKNQSTVQVVELFLVRAKDSSGEKFFIKIDSTQEQVHAEACHSISQQQDLCSDAASLGMLTKSDDSLTSLPESLTVAIQSQFSGVKTGTVVETPVQPDQTQQTVQPQQNQTQQQDQTQQSKIKK